MTVIVNNTAAGVQSSAYASMYSLGGSDVIPYVTDGVAIAVPFTSSGPTNGAGVTSNPSTGRFSISVAGTYQLAFAANIVAPNAGRDGATPCTYGFSVAHANGGLTTASPVVSVSNIPLIDAPVVAASTVLMTAAAGDSFQLVTTTTDVRVADPAISSLNFTCTKVA